MNIHTFGDDRVDHRPTVAYTGNRVEYIRGVSVYSEVEGAIAPLVSPLPSQPLNVLPFLRWSSLFHCVINALRVLSA